MGGLSRESENEVPMSARKGYMWCSVAAPPPPPAMQGGSLRSLGFRVKG